MVFHIVANILQSVINIFTNVKNTNKMKQALITLLLVVVGVIIANKVQAKLPF